MRTKVPLLLSACLLLALSSPLTTAFSASLTDRGRWTRFFLRSSSTDDSAEQATPLHLSTADRERLEALANRHCTRPIMVLDAMVPRQSLTFSSPDPKFCRLIDYCLDNNVDLVMIGLNPYTKKPLSVGVCVELTNVTRWTGSSTVQVTLKATSNRILVEGSPWLDETSSFHLADVQDLLMTDDEDLLMTSEQLSKVQALSDTIPGMMEEWKAAVLAAEATDDIGLQARLDSIGNMPTDPTDRALWVAAAINPLPALGVALEIRPTMLAARSSYARVLLACQSLQSSIDHLLGKKRLF